MLILWGYPLHNTPLAVVSRTRNTVRVSTTAIAQIPAVSSKEGAVIGAVQTHMNNCRINEISNKLKQIQIIISIVRVPPWSEY
jgi:hypothetical protein